MAYRRLGSTSGQDGTLFLGIHSGSQRTVAALLKGIAAPLLQLCVVLPWEVS